MAEITFDLTDYQPRSNVRDWPEGYYEARVVRSERGVSQSSGTPQIINTLELTHPELGTGTKLDYLPKNFPDKSINFYLAINDLTREEFNAWIKDERAKGNPIKWGLDTKDCEGSHLIVRLGTSTNKETGKTYEGSLISPWYYPASRHDLLDYLDAE